MTILITFLALPKERIPVSYTTLLEPVNEEEASEKTKLLELVNEEEVSEKTKLLELVNEEDTSEKTKLLELVKWGGSVREAHRERNINQILYFDVH